MNVLSLGDRRQLADKLRGARQQVAEAVTEEFFQRHPDWDELYGVRGRQLGIEDAAYHIDFLAGAIESGSEIPFETYVRWTTHMLQTRGIAPHFVGENFQQIEKALLSLLSPVELPQLSKLVALGIRLCAEPPAGKKPPPESELTLSRELYLQAILRGERKAAHSSPARGLHHYRHLRRAVSGGALSHRRALGRKQDQRRRGAHGHGDHPVCHRPALPADRDER